MFIFLILVLLSTIFSSTKRLSPIIRVYFVQYSQIFILLHVGYNTPNWSVYNITTGWRSNRVIFSPLFHSFFFSRFLLLFNLEHTGICIIEEYVH